MNNSSEHITCFSVFHVFQKTRNNRRNIFQDYKVKTSKVNTNDSLSVILNCVAISNQNLNCRTQIYKISVKILYLKKFYYLKASLNFFFNVLKKMNKFNKNLVFSLRSVVVNCIIAGDKLRCLTQNQGIYLMRLTPCRINFLLMICLVVVICL